MHEAFLNSLLVAIELARKSGQASAIELELEDSTITITVVRTDIEVEEHA
jgi:hypothetical protein